MEERKEKKKEKRKDEMGMEVPGLAKARSISVSIWAPAHFRKVFGFQPSPFPISQSLPPQENACCLPRHSSHTTGTAGRVFRLWHR